MYNTIGGGDQGNLTTPAKNLFLTGPMGCGKSTCIARALGEHLPKAGGFLTVRQRDDTGRPTAFWLCSADGEEQRKIIDCDGYTMYPEVFHSFATALLESAKEHPFVVLDEIGGFEVLSEPFMKAIYCLLESDVPCIGVLKGPGPASRMMEKLGLGEACGEKTQALRDWMCREARTLLYECGQFDPMAQHMAEQWVHRYVE